MALRSPLTLQPYDYIGDSTGRPLDKGQIYIGVAGQDPEFNQIPVFLDAEMTKPIDQPIRTNDGFVDFAGDLKEIYASEEVYSLKVLDKQGRKVIYKAEMMRDNLTDDALQSLDDAIGESQQAAENALNATVDSITNNAINTVNDAINNTAVDGGVLADTFVTVTANGVGAVARTQRDKNSDIISIKDFPDIATAQSIAEIQDSKIFIPAGEHNYDATSYNPDLFYGDGVVVDTVSGKRYKPNHKWYVTPEMFGAIGDGIADDSDALIAADLYAKDKELSLVGTGKYLITKTWSIKTHSVDISKKGIVIAPNFEHEAAVIGNGNFIPYPSRHRITFYGNKDNQVTPVIAYLTNDQASNSLLVDLVGHFCNTILKVASAVERSEFRVFGSYSDVVVHEVARVGEGDGTADEAQYFISGRGCGQWLYKNAASVCTVDFNVEQTDVAKPFEYAVHIDGTGNKPVTMTGVIRVSECKTIGVTNLSNVNFAGLCILGVKDTAVTLDTSGAVSGNLVLQTTNNGAIDIKKVTRGGLLNLAIDSYTGTGVTIGDSVNRVNNLTLNISIYQGIAGDNEIIRVNNAYECTINLSYAGAKPTQKGIYIANAGVLNNYVMSQSILNKNIPITTESTILTDILITGSTSTNLIRAYTTPITGMRVSSRDHYGRVLHYQSPSWRVATDTAIV